MVTERKSEAHLDREIRQMSPSEARAWCRALRLDWVTFNVDLVKGRSWIELLQIRANQDD